MFFRSLNMEQEAREREKERLKISPKEFVENSKDKG